MSNTTAYNQVKNAGAQVGEGVANAVGDKESAAQMKIKQDEANKQVHKNQVHDSNLGAGDRAEAAVKEAGDEIKKGIHHIEKAFEHNKPTNN